MGKTSGKDAAEAESSTGGKKRSKLKLAVLAIVPLALAGGGYAGWTQFVSDAGAKAGEHGEGAHAADAQDEHAQALALPPEIRAETSMTHSYALSVLVRADCGRFRVEALKAAAAEEAAADGQLATLSWEAAARRAAELGKASCGHLRAEIDLADAKAAKLADEKAKPAKGKGGGGH